MACLSSTSPAEALVQSPAQLRLSYLPKVSKPPTRRCEIVCMPVVNWCQGGSARSLCGSCLGPGGEGGLLRPHGWPGWLGVAEERNARLDLGRAALEFGCPGTYG